MTYSIIALDKHTGQMGVAVQTFNLAVGTWVPWGEGGVGVVATQALAERAYGTQGLDLMRGGKSAPDSLTALRAVDEKSAYRQVAMLDVDGNIAVHTGERCFPEAGSYLGSDFCTQANMMARDTVWDAMAEAYQTAEGDLADRLMAALFAAQSEGGDIRGQQTAALLIVDSKRNAIPLIDLRVDYDPNPLEKIQTLLRFHRGYMAEYAIANMLTSENRETIRQQLDFIQTLAPDEGYLQFLRSLHLATALDDWETAIKDLRKLIQRQPIWREYLERESKVDNFGVAGLGNRLLQALDKDMVE